ncbi:hypothetical protein BDQ17DRAFT_1424879 [Cyathus striatus]|nr:hypothetical protein BDQ17DRAFT_1424879 [Cyathus striatus]
MVLIREPRLPLDVWDHIINKVALISDGARTTTLKVCSILCKDILRRSRHHLFHSITLSHLKYSDDIQRNLSQTAGLASSPDLTRHVRELHLIDRGVLFIDQNPKLSGLLSMINNLTTIEVRIYDRSAPMFHFTNLSRPLRDTLITFSLSPFITNLSIEGIVDLPQELAQRCASIPNVELGCLSLLPEPNLSIANAQVDIFQPLLEALQNEECTLETLIVARETAANHEITDECLISESLMRMYSSTITTFECQRPTVPLMHSCMALRSHSNIRLGTCWLFAVDLDSIDISLLPHLKTVKLVALSSPWRRPLDFYRDSLNSVRQALAKATNENKIQDIFLNVHYPVLSSSAMQTYDQTHGWKALDELLTLPKFQKLMKVDVQLINTTLELNKMAALDDSEAQSYYDICDNISENLYEVPESDRKKIKEYVLWNYLPRLHEKVL